MTRRFTVRDLENTPDLVPVGTKLKIIVDNHYNPIFDINETFYYVAYDGEYAEFAPNNDPNDSKIDFLGSADVLEVMYDSPLGGIYD